MNNFEVLKEIKRDFQKLGNTNYDATNIMEVYDSIFEKYYDRVKFENKDDILTDVKCPHCSNDLFISDIIYYDYVCNDCDENFYSCELDCKKEWYEETKYNLQIWETEEDRTQGNSYIYLNDFTNKDEAIEECKKLINRTDYACIEVIENDTKKVIYGYAEGQEYFNDNGIEIG